MITGRPRIFQEGEIKMDCDVCGAYFSVTGGGVCSKCRRVLCSRHLYGSWTHRLISEITRKTLCVDCRGG